MTTTPQMPVVILQGTPVERGRQHGARFVTEIQDALSKMRTQHSGAAFAAARKRAEAAWPLIRGIRPETVEEIEGIATGVLAHPTDILLHMGFEFFLEPAPTGCSAVAIEAQPGALVAQNWDAPEGAMNELALFLHFGARGFEYAVIASVGGLGWVGCNRDGLAFVNNDLLLKQSADGIPSQVVRRVILAQTDVAAAIDKLRTIQHMGGRSYLIADRHGHAAAVEVSTSGIRVIDEKPPLFHTNHPIHPDIAGDSDEAALQRIYPSSRARLDMLGLHAESLRDAASLMRLLRNEDGAPDAICKRRSEAEATETAFSVVFDCARRDMYLCTGEPSRGGYVKFSLPN